MDTTLKAKIPIQGHLNVPIKSALQATVDVQNTLPVKIEKGQLKIPLSSLRLSRDLEEKPTLPVEKTNSSTTQTE